MKNLTRILSIVMAVAFTSTVIAQGQAPSGIVKLRGTRLTYPLVRKWIEEFNKEYPKIIVTIAPSAPADSIDFTIASYALSESELEGGKHAVVVARYVQLPIVNAQRPGLAEWQAKGISEKNFNELFFPSPEPFIASVATKPNIYIRDRPTCAVKAFATHYGKDPKQIKGTGIKGDDEDLAGAVKKDINGIAFNNLGFIYDVKTRLIRDSLAIIPLDLNENGKVDKDEQIYGTLDEVINFIEKTGNPKFVNERVNFTFREPTTNSPAGLFLLWALNKGQAFNHQFGFIDLNQALLAEEKTLVVSKYKISSQSSCDGSEKLEKERKKTKQ